MNTTFHDSPDLSYGADLEQQIAAAGYDCAVVVAGDQFMVTTDAPADNVIAAVAAHSARAATLAQQDADARAAAEAKLTALGLTVDDLTALGL